MLFPNEMRRESGNRITTKTALVVVHTHPFSLNRKEAVSGNLLTASCFFHATFG